MKTLILLTIVLCIPFLAAMGQNEAEEQGDFLVKNLLEKAFGADDHDVQENEDNQLLGSGEHDNWEENRLDNDEDNEEVFGNDAIADLVQDILAENLYGGDEDQQKPKRRHGRGNHDNKRKRSRKGGDHDNWKKEKFEKFGGDEDFFGNDEDFFAGNDEDFFADVKDNLYGEEEEEEFFIEDPSILYGSEDLDFSVEDYEKELKKEEMKIAIEALIDQHDEDLMDEIDDLIEESVDEGEERLLQDVEEDVEIDLKEWEPKEDEEWRPEGEGKGHKGKGKKGKWGKKGKKGKWGKKGKKGKKGRKNHKGKRGSRNEQDDQDYNSQNFRMDDDENMGAFVLLMILAVCGKILCWACICGGCFKLGSKCQEKKIKAQQAKLDRQVRAMRGISMQQPQQFIAQPQFSLGQNQDQRQVFLAQPMNMQYPVAQLV